MKLIQILIVGALALFNSEISAESIEYEIRDLSSDTILHSGTRSYSRSDLIVHNYRASGRWYSEVLVELEAGFKIGARLLAEESLTGFGLVAELDDGDFSWEWFDHEIASTFAKRQEYGRVRIETGGLPNLIHLRAVTFLTDIDLCFKNKYATQRVEEDTHCVNVKSGSVLRFE